MPALLRRPTPHLEAKEGVWCEEDNEAFIVVEILAPHIIWHASPAWLSFTGFLPSDGMLLRPCIPTNIRPSADPSCAQLSRM